MMMVVVPTRCGQCAARCNGGRRRWTWQRAAISAVPVLLLLLLFEPVNAAPEELVPTTSKDDSSPTSLPPCDVDGAASRDVTLLNGSEFEMTCTLTRWVPGEKYEMAILRSRDHPVPKSETRLNNATSVTWRRPHVGDADAGTYYCLVRGATCESVYNATGLVVGYSPQMPATPTCSGQKFETFQCGWETPDNRIETRYTVSLLVGPRTAFSRIECKNSVSIEPRNLTCQLKTSGRLIYRIEEEVLRFEIVGSNMFGAKKWEYVVDHFANVVLEPPKVVYCNALTFNASVNWTGLPPISTFPDVVYEVRVKHDNGADITISVQNRRVTSVEKLIPNTRYGISVRVKFAKATDKVWSPFSHSRYCKTGKTRPTVLPKVAENSFIIQDLDDRRKVRLYYQRVPKFLWNGDHMSYVLHWCSSSGECGTHRVSGERSHADLFNLSRVESYTFHLFSENELGRSNRSVRVVVPSADLVLPPVQHACISEDRDSQSRFSLAKWDERRREQVHHYTLFWCRQDSKDAETCDGDLSWASVKSAGDALTALGCAFAGLCRYGVATRSAQSVSPMVWIECVVPRSKEYQSLFQGQDSVHYDEITDTTVQLAFLTKCSGLVASRVIRLCTVQGQDEPQRNETSLEAAADTNAPNATDADLTECFEELAGPEKTVRISNLKPATTYQADVKTTLEDGTTVNHRLLIFKTQAKSSVFIATSFIVLYVVLVIVAVAAILSWKRISEYISVYKNTPIKVLIPADFVKEPIKKSESVRSNLREYVLGRKDCPYGLPQIVPRQAKEVEDSLHSPELDLLIGEGCSGEPNAVDAAETSYVADKSCSTNQLAAGYSVLSTTQDDTPVPGSNSAYSKLSSFHEAPEGMPKPSLLSNYSRLSSMFLSTCAASAAEKNGYSKFAAFLDKPSTGDEKVPETLKPPDCSVAMETASMGQASPYIQVGEDGDKEVAEDERPMQPYAKLGCTSSFPSDTASSSQGPPQKPENRVTGYTPFPSLISMSKLSEGQPKASAKLECTEKPCLRDSATWQSDPSQPYAQASFNASPPGDVPSEGRDCMGPYTILNMGAPLGQSRDTLPGGHCAPPYVKASQEPSRASLGSDSLQVKNDEPAPAYSKVGAPTAQLPQDRQDSSANEDSGTCVKGPAVVVQSPVPESCCDFTALAPLAHPEGSGVVGDRDELDGEWGQCAEEGTDLFSVEYSVPAAKESMSAKPTLRGGGYTSWEVLAKQRDCDGDARAQAVKNA
uniref:Cytokine receptor like protein n=1 Tax=Rhipicephalus appendiculatus TaxID=34631 RepID=A0A131Y9E9_RHIAP